MTVNYAKHVSTRITPQSEPIPGSDQVPNSAGGHAWQVDHWTRLRRFLILGNEGGSYYATEKAMTAGNCEALLECADEDPFRTVDLISAISTSGLAPKNDQAVFCLARLCAHPRARELALLSVPRVCRTGTHLFQFIEAVKQFRGWGRSLRRAVSQWYLGKDPRDLAYQLVKYQQRNGWSHRDVLRKCHPLPDLDTVRGVGQHLCMTWAVGKPVVLVGDAAQDLSPIIAFEQAKTAKTEEEIVDLIRRHGLVRECIPTQFLNSKEVWRALLDSMPMHALIRNLGKMSNVGLLAPLSAECASVAERFRDANQIKQSRLHPMSILLAQGVYQSGKGVKGSLTWSPDSGIVSALEDAFHSAFVNVEPTGKRIVLALDVSGSMGSLFGGSHLTCRDVSAAMALVTIKTEPLTYACAFTAEWDGRSRNNCITELAFGKTETLTGAVRKVSGLEFGSTDCALPMLHALEKGIQADVFIVYTDNETWFGKIHPAQALKQYREKTGINAKLILVSIVANKFSIADPNDPGMLDVVGFDASVPQIINDFIAQ